MKYSLKQRFQYKFDQIMSRGTSALMMWLGLLSATLIIVTSVILFLQKSIPDKNFWQLIWGNFLGTLGEGIIDGDDTNWLYILITLTIILGGLFIVSSLVGILTTGMEAKLESLRKGRSKVIETGHTVILGWSEEIFTIISELVTANANLKKSYIVIMGEKDKVEMEEAIRDYLGPIQKTRIVCREGNPILVNDLDIVSLAAAKSIIILSPAKDDPDSNVIKIILAITNNSARKKGSYHIVAEIRDQKNMEAAHIVGKDEAEIVLVGDLISRITAQTCRQSGLSSVYTELLDFGGCEIYFTEQPTLVGKNYAEIQPLFSESSVIGIKQNGHNVKTDPSH